MPLKILEKIMQDQLDFIRVWKRFYRFWIVLFFLNLSIGMIDLVNGRKVFGFLSLIVALFAVLKTYEAQQFRMMWEELHQRYKEIYDKVKNQLSPYP